MHDSSFGRMLGVLVAPGKTFRSIAERPTWILPVLLLAGLGTGAAYMMQQRVDQEEMVRHQAEILGQEPSEEQIQQQVEVGEKMAPVLLILVPVATVAIFLIVALVYWGAFKMLGSDMDFKSSLATSVHASMPAAIALLLNILLLLGRSSVTPEEASKNSVLTSSAAILLPEDAGPVVKSLLGSLDVFSIWSLVLFIIGYGVVAKVSPKAAAITVIVLWLLVVLVQAGFAAFVGSMGGGAGA